MKRADIRNVAIVAHVDHGKTTLVDAMLRQSGAFRANQEVAERVMDSMDLEREKGITILAKNTAVRYGDLTINIVDTPGHADFGGEVERGLTMVDGVLLLVDASEGPLPQTRFVLRKTLEARLPVICVINKIDRPDARAAEVDRRGVRAVPRSRRRRAADRVPDRLLQRPGRPGRHGRRRRRVRRPDLKVLLDLLVEHIPAPDLRGGPPLPGAGDQPRRLALRRPPGAVPDPQRAGSRRATRWPGAATTAPWSGSGSPSCTSPRPWSGSTPRRREPGPGDIIAVAGIPEIMIGDTLADPDDPRPLPVITIDEPSIGMTLGVNTSPLAGKAVGGEHSSGGRAPSSRPASSRAASTPSWSAT